MQFLLLCPSNQGYNEYPDGSTEADNMVHLCAKVAQLAQGISDLTVVSIPGAPDDGRDPLLRALGNQLDAAANYLEALRVVPADGVIQSVHTDSSKTSHLANCYGGEIGGPSWQLGEHLVAAVRDVMQPAEIYQFDYTYYMFYRRRGPYTANLFECGSDESEHDLEYLLHLHEALAEAILVGALGYFGLRMAPERQPARDAAALFSMFGVPFNPEAAIAKYWVQAWRTGDIGNMGPALRPEEDGARNGQHGHIVQFFANAVVDCNPAENWKCRRAQVVMEPALWLKAG